MDGFKGVEVAKIKGVFSDGPETLEGHAVNGGCVLFVLGPDQCVRFKMDGVVQLRDWLNQVIEKCQWDQGLANSV